MKTRHLILLATLLAAPLLRAQTDQADATVWYSAPVAPYIGDRTVLDLPRVPDWQPGTPIKEIPKRRKPLPPGYRPEPRSFGEDPLLQQQFDAELAAEPLQGRAFSATIINRDGQGYTFVNPPDTVGDVGKQHYVQMINAGGGATFAVYDKADGTLLAGPILLDGLVSGGACANGAGDPIVLYDEYADRWLLTEFANIGNHLCVYVSTGPNILTTTWYRYDFTTPFFPDYPKYSIWPDAYYVTSNENLPAVYALDRASMLQGLPATSQRMTASDLAFPFQALTPAEPDGLTPAPPDSAGLFMRHRDDEVHNPGSNIVGEDYLELWAMAVDWQTPANTSFAKLQDIATAEFDSDLCGIVSFSCFPQPGASPALDPLREVIMHRLQYRNFGSHEALVGNFVTDVSGTDQGGVRWFELRRTDGGNWTLHQEGTYAPDATNRWMGGISMDGSGNIALAYNVTSSSVFPGIRYAGRLAGDPLGTLPSGESTIVAGSASNSSIRYGDYSAMSVDPVDDCTFWFTGEYNPSANWSTRIASFRFDSCGSCNGATSISGLQVPAGTSLICNLSSTADFSDTLIEGSFTIDKAAGAGFTPSGSVGDGGVLIINEIP